MEALILALLQKDPRSRPKTAKDVRAELLAIARRSPRASLTDSQATERDVPKQAPDRAAAAFFARRPTTAAQVRPASAPPSAPPPQPVSAPVPTRTSSRLPRGSDPLPLNLHDQHAAVRRPAGPASRAPAGGLSEEELRRLIAADDFVALARAYRERLGFISGLSALQLAHIGRAALEQGDVATAVLAFGRIGSEHPSSRLAPRALLHAGFLLERRMGLPDEAERMFRHLLRAYPDSEQAPQARAALGK
jgi:tetratricopeptide (TPR) repeat protein